MGRPRTFGTVMTGIGWRVSWLVLWGNMLLNGTPFFVLLYVIGELSVMLGGDERRPGFRELYSSNYRECNRKNYEYNTKDFQ